MQSVFEICGCIKKTLFYKNIIAGKSLQKREENIMRASKMSHANEGIKCEVNTCYFYMNGDHCTADMIEVQHKNAHTSQETDCATFKPQA